jgi:hypothetical protein
MNCLREDLKVHITDVVVGEAEMPVKELVLTHLETCDSCRADREQIEQVLGLLKESPPWTASGDGEAGSDRADMLSTIQRQKIESLAGRSVCPRGPQGAGGIDVLDRHGREPVRRRPGPLPRAAGKRDAARSADPNDG